MRNRIKQLLNKEEGFTLVELLAVIVILAIILAIAVPGVGKIIDNAELATEKNQESIVLDAAQLYFLQTENHGDEVTSTTLKEKGFLEDKKMTKVYTVTIETDETTGKETFNITGSDTTASESGSGSN
ncbi:prepilin-type N-terminal cleavage/methylation domain-containing protein [Jeotgalibaca arthritidis]|uniref:Prepilin-type N-terminal cleavage/methylation domain-containing protein n=1 Tax=Jeotgalibaca arthritidis TaxID=1868794 RepID=A0A6G7K855_9LACT|nr:prepilin-type N-terminal cleavage/methylation domain-containing protein [Jeotgalibaca arthritidis]QII81435.1 prepilin-type N-terminal cleavage/methylation domain-containing protein [Jeotgalibaca arthritidis]